MKLIDAMVMRIPTRRNTIAKKIPNASGEIKFPYEVVRGISSITIQPRSIAVNNWTSTAMNPAICFPERE